MKRNALVTMLAGSALALTAWQLAPAGHDAGHAMQSASASPSIAAANSNAPVTGAGYVVHLDENGQIADGPAPEDVATFNRELEAAISTSHEGLTVENNPAGGITIDLKGRFQSVSTATIDANGNLQVPCLTNEADVHTFTAATAADRAAAKE